jgi:Ca2+-binding RTX toxin-like protein
MTAFTGTSGGDTFVGTSGDDSFDLHQGGDDTADGGGGNDSFSLGTAFDANDRLTGGGGIDTLDLDGDYSAGVVLGANLVGFEGITMDGGHSYRFTVTDAVATDDDRNYFDVAGYTLGASDTLYFDGSAEVFTSFNLHGGAGDDTMIGGGGSDTFDLFAGGNDSCFGGAGTEFFTFEGVSFTRDDRLDGGDDYDHLSLNGDYTGGVKFGLKSIRHIEEIDVFHSHSYVLKTNDGNVAAGETLLVDAAFMDVGQFIRFSGKFEKDGSFEIDAGQGDDRLMGGAMDDTISGGDGKDRLFGKDGADLLTGGEGADSLTGAGGGDTFVFLSTEDSKIGKADLILDLQKIDVIDLSSIDADSGTGGDQAFNLVGAFTNHAGQAVLSYDGGTDRTSLMLDTDGDGASDSTILMVGDQTGFHHFVL